MKIKVWIKQGIYRLLGGSRRDIINDVTSELRQEQKQLMAASFLLEEQLSQMEKWIYQELESIADC